MKTPVSLQLAQVAASVMLGFLLGGLYDVLRVIRRRTGSNAVPDVLFWMASLASVFSLGMDIGGGSMHIFMLCSVMLGFALYMLLLSPAVLKLLDAIAGFFAFIFRPIRKVLGIFSKTVKKLFAKFANCCTMLMRKTEKGVLRRNEKIDDDSRSGIDDTGRICYSEPGKHQGRPERRDGADQSAESRDRAGAGDGS